MFKYTTFQILSSHYVKLHYFVLT